jgi:hypothetical protein
VTLDLLARLLREERGIVAVARGPLGPFGPIRHASAQDTGSRALCSVRCFASFAGYRSVPAG